MTATLMANTNTLGLRSKLILLPASEVAVTTVLEGEAVGILREGPRTREMSTLLTAKRRLIHRYRNPKIKATPNIPHLTDRRVQNIPAKSSCRIQSSFWIKPRRTVRTMTHPTSASKLHLRRWFFLGGSLRRLASWVSSGGRVIFSMTVALIVYPSVRPSPTLLTIKQMCPRNLVNSEHTQSGRII